METSEAPFTLGKSKWERRSELPDMWKVVHQCENAGLNIYATETITRLYILFQQHEAATLEEFLGKFAEGAEKKDFYKFSKYCMGLYRNIYKGLLASNMHPVERNLVQELMKGAADMDQLGDEHHENPKDDYWQTNASVIGPDDRELPRSYVKLRGQYIGFEDFLRDHKEFDKVNEEPAPRIIINRKRTAHAVHDALGK